MKSFTIPLVKKGNYYFPVIKLQKIPTLIDTGATIPVFSIEPPILCNRLGTKLVMENKSITGFGGKADGNIYSIPQFKVGELVFKDCEVFVPNKIILEHLPIILSASMFYGTIFTFDTINGNFTVKMKAEQSYERSFKIKDNNGMLYPVVNGVLIQSYDYNFQSLLIGDKNGEPIDRIIRTNHNKNKGFSR